MPSILKPKPEDDFPLVGIYRTLIKGIIVGGIGFSALLMIVLGKGLF